MSGSRRSSPRPVSPPAPTAVIDWFMFQLSPPGSRSRSTSPVSRSVWYGFSTSIPAARQEPEHGEDYETADHDQREELPPAHADEEEQREERSRVDERGSEIRLEEHEQDRGRPEADRVEDRAPARHPAGALDEEAGESEDEQHLPELRRLELDEAEVDPALGASNGLGDEEDERASGQASTRTATRQCRRARSMGTTVATTSATSPMPAAIAWRIR